MNYIKEISLKDNLYFIKLPNKTDKVYLDILVKSGYVEETDKEFGMGHLLEHYLIRMLRNIEKPKRLQVEGSIGKEDMKFSLYSSLAEITEQGQDFINTILKPEFTDKQAFQSEKEVLINELYIKIGDLENLLEQAVLTERVDKQCHYTRTREDQIRNIKKIKLEGLEKYHQKFFTKGNIVFTLSAYQLKPQVIQEILSCIKKCRLTAKPVKYGLGKCKYSKFKIKFIKSNNHSKLNSLGISFPIYSTKIRPAQRTPLRILGHLLSNTLDGLLKELRVLGIYDLDYTKLVWRNMGMIYFYSFIPDEKILPLLELFNQAIKELKNKEISKKKLDELKKQVKESDKNAFEDNLDRINWINYDLIYYGKVTPIKEDLEIIDKITTQSLKAEANNIFKKEKVNVIIIGKNTNKVQKDKIKKLLDF